MVHTGKSHILGGLQHTTLKHSVQLQLNLIVEAPSQLDENI